MKISELSLIETAWIDEKLSELRNELNSTRIKIHGDTSGVLEQISLLGHIKNRLRPATILAEKAFEAGEDNANKGHNGDSICNLQDFLNETEI